MLRHIADASHRLAKTAIAVSRLMSNEGGLFGAKKAILMTVAISRMLYAVPV